MFVIAKAVKLTHGKGIMDGFDQFAKGLTDEVMTDMAENFFSNRSRLEKDIERFERQAARLSQKLETLCGRYRFLENLLPGKDMVQGFFTALEAPAPVFDCGARACSTGFYPAPKALTGKGRWTKYVLKAYRLFWNDADEYLFGHYVTDEGGVKKRLTVNRKSLLTLCEDVNARVEQVNTAYSPVCVLQYVKTLDPERMDRERLSGATLAGYACSLEDKMNFTPVDFENYRLPGFEPYPKPEAAKPLIEKFCHGHYSGHKDLIAAAVKKAGTAA